MTCGRKLSSCFLEYIATPKPMLHTATKLRSFNKATTCHICTKPLGDDKVRDHCHIVGSYRGAAHSECNVRRNEKINTKAMSCIHIFKEIIH